MLPVKTLRSVGEGVSAFGSYKWGRSRVVFKGAWVARVGLAPVVLNDSWVFKSGVGFVFVNWGGVGVMRGACFHEGAGFD